MTPGLGMVFPKFTQCGGMGEQILDPTDLLPFYQEGEAATWG